MNINSDKRKYFEAKQRNREGKESRGRKDGRDKSGYNNLVTWDVNGGFKSE